MRMHLSIKSGMSAFKYSELAKASFLTTLQIVMINFMKKIFLYIFRILCKKIYQTLGDQHVDLKTSNTSVEHFLTRESNTETVKQC